MLYNLKVRFVQARMQGTKLLCFHLIIKWIKIMFLREVKNSMYLNKIYENKHMIYGYNLML